MKCNYHGDPKFTPCTHRIIPNSFPPRCPHGQHQVPQYNRMLELSDCGPGPYDWYRAVGKGKEFSQPGSAVCPSSVAETATEAEIHAEATSDGVSKTL